MTEEEIYRKAKKKVNAKKGFYAHFGSYCVGVLFFFTINYMTYSEHDDVWWFLFPTLGWGMGLASHYFAVFGMSFFGNEDWEEKQMEKEVRKLERQHGYQPIEDDDITVPDDELELKEFKKLRKEWDDQDLV